MRVDGEGARGRLCARLTIIAARDVADPPRREWGTSSVLAGTPLPWGAPAPLSPTTVAVLAAQYNIDPPQCIPAPSPRSTLDSGSEIAEGLVSQGFTPAATQRLLTRLQALEPRERREAEWLLGWEND